MDDLIWAGIRAIVLSHMLKVMLTISVVAGWITWGFMAAKWKASLYNKIKRESNLESLLDTPMKERDTKMEGNTTFDFPEDEGRTRKMCPFCGEIYSQELIIRCIHDGYDLVERPLSCKHLRSQKQELERELQTTFCDEEADFLFDIMDTYHVDLCGVDGKKWQAMRVACWTGQNPEQYTNFYNGPLDMGFAMISSVQALLILAELRLHDSYHEDGESAA